jgi:hypothetical protein
VADPLAYTSVNGAYSRLGTLFNPQARIRYGRPFRERPDSGALARFATPTRMAPICTKRSAERDMKRTADVNALSPSASMPSCGMGSFGRKPRATAYEIRHTETKAIVLSAHERPAGARRRREKI